MSTPAGPASSGGPPVLAAEDVVAGYLPGVDILRRCTVVVGEGELVGIIGPNGAGKSTLVKAVFGLVPVRAGRVTLRGADVTGRPAHELVARRMGYVPQRDNVFGTLTVSDNLRMGGFLVGKRLAERVDVVTGLFPWLGHRLGQRAGSLSGGERQMLAMARALIADPEVLLLDEPSAGLSPMVQDEVFARIVAVNATGVSVLMVEQNARRCLEIAHRAYVLDGGRPAHEGPGGVLLADERVAELYLGTLGRRG